MANSDGFLNKFTKIERTKIVPLRWIGNYCGGIAGHHLVKAIHMDDHDDHSFMYHFHGRMWITFNKPYERWGTYYKMDFDGKP